MELMEARYVPRVDAAAVEAMEANSKGKDGRGKGNRGRSSSQSRQGDNKGKSGKGSNKGSDGRLSTPRGGSESQKTANCLCRIQQAMQIKIAGTCTFGLS